MKVYVPGIGIIRGDRGEGVAVILSEADRTRILELGPGLYTYSQAPGDGAAEALAIAAREADRVDGPEI